MGAGPAIKGHAGAGEATDNLNEIGDGSAKLLNHFAGDIEAKERPNKRENGGEGCYDCAPNGERFSPPFFPVDC